jgi:hypothetical protein
MSNKNLSAEQIDTNYKKVLEFVEKLGERSEVVKSMLDVIGERYALCSASSRLDQHSCFPGGLIEHSLNVLVNALKIRKAFEYDISLESIIITALFHDLGKIGNLEESYYVEQDSQWHRDKLGEMYKYNKNIQFTTVPHRSIFLLQHFGIKLALDEMIAILIHDGQYVDDNKSYKNREPQLADLIHQADFIASKQEKG